MVPQSLFECINGIVHEMTAIAVDEASLHGTSDKGKCI
jgi:hypothetical protein